jgi:hypothetical protein
VLFKEKGKRNRELNALLVLLLPLPYYFCLLP